MRPLQQEYRLIISIKMYIPQGMEPYISFSFCWGQTHITQLQTFAFVTQATVQT